jgi:hypothetical protein
LDVTQFVDTDYFYSDDSQDQCLASSGGMELYMKAPKRVQLENVTPLQWTGASIRILCELTRTGELKSENVFQYLAYMAKVTQLAEHHMWRSVLYYDRAYRQAQAQNGFPWGSDSPHLATVHLKPRGAALVTDVNASRGVKRAPSAGTASRHQKDKDMTPTSPCRLYNRNGECPFTPCRFRHICSAPNCGQSHPLAQHPKSQGN